MMTPPTLIQNSTSPSDSFKKRNMIFDYIKKRLCAMRLFLPIAATVASIAAFTACDDETSKIGSSLTEGEIQISIDTISYVLNARADVYDNYDSRTGNLLLGNLNVPEYGSLNCSFVTRLMCATALYIPDSLVSPEKVDSCKLFMYMSRGDITGDSLAPQRVNVYNLTKQLPSDITNSFDPKGYYNPSEVFGTTSFTASLAGTPDSVFTDLTYNTVPVTVPLSEEFGKEIFRLYKEKPETFAWPQTFAQIFPGLFIETSFGKGCVSNISQLRLYIYFHYNTEKTTVVDGETVTTLENTVGAVAPFVSSPEVLSSNNISYNVSDYIKNLVANGDMVITTPGGYRTAFRFPTQDLIRRYEEKKHNLSLISDLSLTIPAETIENDFGIGATPTLLLIKSDEVESFFNENKLPDGKTSFTADFDATNNRYRFSSMRQYILDMLEKGSVSDDDCDFTLIPVTLTTETVNSGYSTSEYVTKCTPYTTKPTMTRLHTDQATVIFTFSSQLLE